MDIEGVRVLGTSKVSLSRTDCSAECNIGNLITDAAVHYYIDHAHEGEWTHASIALTNNGGIRTSLSAGSNDFFLSFYSKFVNLLPLMFCSNYLC